MKRIMFIICVLGALMGCYRLSTEQRIAITAGKIGCPPEKTTISNLVHPGKGMSTWTAKCKDKIYSCSRDDTGASSCTKQ